MLERNRKFRARATGCGVSVLCAALLVGTALLPTRAAAQDRVAEAQAVSARLEQEGRFSDAASAVEALLPDYPQDAGLWLRSAWLRFRDQEYEASLAAYEKVLALSPGSLDAMLGAGWCHYYLGSCADAAALFEQVLASAPASESAMEGQRLCAPKTTAAPFAGGIFHLYRGHPTKRQAWGFSAGLPLTVSDHYIAGAVYRYLNGKLKGGTGAPGRWSDNRSYAQHEGWGQVGLAWHDWGVAAHYGFADGGGVDDLRVHVAALSGRVTAWGSAVASVAAGFYDGITTLQGTADYVLPVGARLRITPGLLYTNAGESAVAGQLALDVYLDALKLACGGRYGRELRPISLTDSLVYNIEDEIRYGAWGAATVGLGAGLSLSALYELNGLSSPSAAGDVQSLFHVFVLSLSTTIPPE